MTRNAPITKKALGGYASASRRLAGPGPRRGDTTWAIFGSGQFRRVSAGTPPPLLDDGVLRTCASRITHPELIHLLAALCALVTGDTFAIDNPYLSTSRLAKDHRWRVALRGAGYLRRQFRWHQRSERAEDDIHEAAFQAPERGTLRLPFRPLSCLGRVLS